MVRALPSSAPRFPAPTISLNAAESHSYGAEIEVRYGFDSGLERFAGLGLMNLKFDKGDFKGHSKGAAGGWLSGVRNKPWPSVPSRRPCGVRRRAVSST